MMLLFPVVLSCCIGVVYGQLPDVVTIESLTNAGRGCPSESVVGSVVSEDRTTLTLSFDDYVAVMEPGRSIRDARKRCQVNIGLQIPAGWSYSVVTVEYRGSMHLEEGTYAALSALQPSGGFKERLETRWDGPYTGDYSLIDSFPLEDIVWSACGGSTNLYLYTDIRLGGDKERSTYLSTNSMDGKVSIIFGLQWMECSW